MAPAYLTSISLGAYAPCMAVLAMAADANTPIAASAQQDAARISERSAKRRNDGRWERGIMRGLVMMMCPDRAGGTHCRRDRGETDERALLPTR